MTKSCFSLLLISLSFSVSGQQQVVYPDFQIPPEYSQKADYNPSLYLAKYPVANTGQQLSDEKKEKLACLILTSEKVSQDKFKHSFMVDLKQPLIALTMSNFPHIKEMEWGGRKDANVKYMSLTQIAKGLEGQVDQKLCNS